MINEPCLVLEVDPTTQLLKSLTTELRSVATTPSCKCRAHFRCGWGVPEMSARVSVLWSTVLEPQVTSSSTLLH